MNSYPKLGLKKLASNATITLSRQLTAGLLQLATVVIIARALGPEGNGQYTIALLLPSILATFLNIGVAPANVYYLSAGKVDAGTAFHTINQLALFIIIVGLGAGALFIIFYSENWFPSVPQPFLWYALSIFPFTLFQSFLSSIFQGLQKFNIFNIVLLTQPTVNLFLVLMLHLLDAIHLEYVLAAHLIGFATMVSISLIKIKTEITLGGPAPIQQKYIKKAVNYGYKAHLSNILAFVNYKADIFLVNLLINPAAAGIYVVAVQVAERLWLFSQSVSTVVLPRLSELSNNEEKRKQVTPIICRFVIAVTFLSAVLLASMAFPFINLFFGNEYTEAALILIFLLPGIVAGSGARILANDIAARGRPELNMYFTIIVVTMNITGNILLIPKYGLQGAAMATSSAYLLNFFLRLIVYKRISGNKFSDSILLTPEDITKISNVLKQNRFYRRICG